MHTALLRLPHTDATLPPVAPQKGKRDAQVQFLGRRQTSILKSFKKMKKLPPEEEAIEQKRFVMQWEFYKVPFKESVALL
ncbi:hypothetical protein T03_12015 [Trichinella britovi]|uniref:Uncharacterized protein n=1 Tax=Trichinella britovi TaxID=45882 RepID=A0A0V1BIP8_TRIBR|nr:hypothetical protein T03_12015 [Trichinella britovi]